MGPVEEERSPDEDADALKACEIRENNKYKTKTSVSRPAENDNKPESMNYILKLFYPFCQYEKVSK